MTTTTFHHTYTASHWSHDLEVPKKELYIQTDAGDCPTDVEWVDRLACVSPIARTLYPPGQHRGDIQCNVTVSDGTIHHVQAGYPTGDWPTDRCLGYQHRKTEGKKSPTTAAPFTNRASTHKQTRRLHRWEIMQCGWQQIKLAGDSAGFRICKQTKTHRLDPEKEGNQS
jgi:hypothetical protein